MINTLARGALGSQARSLARRLGRDRRGQAAVEMALMMPLLVLVILIMVQLFLVSDQASRVVIETYRQALDYHRQLAGSNRFAYMHQVKVEEPVEVLPGLDRLFEETTGESLSQAGASQWRVIRRLYITAGSVPGTGKSAYGRDGDGQGLAHGGAKRRNTLSSAGL